MLIWHTKMSWGNKEDTLVFEISEAEIFCTKNVGLVFESDYLAY